MAKKQLSRVNFINLSNIKTDIDPTCKNCRNLYSQVCNEWLKQKRRYLAKNKRPLKKAYCKFWAYKSNGLWS